MLLNNIKDINGKKLLLFALCFCSFQFLYTDNNKQLLEILNISEPIKRQDIGTIKGFATLLALQDELMLLTNKLFKAGVNNKQKIADIYDFISQSEFMFTFPMPYDEYGWAIDFDKVKTGFATSVFMKFKNFLAKEENFSEQEKLLAKKLSQNSNPEVRFVGEFKTKAIEQSEASDYYKKEIEKSNLFLLKFTHEFIGHKEKLPETIKPLFQAAATIAFHEELSTVTDELELFEKALITYDTIFETYQLNKLYQDARSLLRKQSNASKLLMYENISGESKLLPSSLDNSFKETITPSPESSASSEKKQIFKKKRKTQKKKKPVKKTGKAKQRIPKQVEKTKEQIAEPSQLITDDSELEIRNELINWYNTQFPVSDKSFVSDITDFQITISDPKNNADIVLFRKSQGDEKIISSPLNYDGRVRLWFENPQKALEEGSYTQKYNSLLKLKEFEARHNFAQIADAFLDKEGIDIQYIDKYGRSISGTLLAGELQLKQPDGSIEKISGVFSYGKIPGVNKYYHRYLSDKEYKEIVEAYYGKSKWEVEFPPLGS